MSLSSQVPWAMQRRPPCTICGRPTIPSPVAGALQNFCGLCKARKPGPLTTEWGLSRQAQRKAERANELGPPEIALDPWNSP